MAHGGRFLHAAQYLLAAHDGHQEVEKHHRQRLAELPYEPHGLLAIRGHEYLVRVLQEKLEHLAVDRLVINDEDAALSIDGSEVCASFEHGSSLGGTGCPMRKSTQDPTKETTPTKILLIISGLERFC